MSLATRCTHCGTVFRVVQDQLKVSEGQVRCGRCSEVFNALEGLFDLDGSSGSMGLHRESGPMGLHKEPRAQAHAPAPRDFDTRHREPQEPAPVAAPASAPTNKALPDVDASTPDNSEPAASDVEDTRVDSTFTRSRPRSRLDIEAVDSMVPDDALLMSSQVAEFSPSFILDETRSSHWKRPRVRRALWVLSLLLVLILTTQVVVREHDSMGARWPEARPALAAMCTLFGCQLEAPRVLNSMVVESSGLTRVDGAPLYRLQITLRNRDVTPVLTPALDLTLTDLRGTVVARRVLSGNDFGPASPRHLAAGGDWSVDAVLDLGDTRVAGYTVELFYP